MMPLTRLAFSAFLAYTSYAMCRVPVLPLFAQSLGAGPAAIGVVMAMSTLTGVLLKAPAGVLSDRIGRGAVLITAGVVFASLPLAYGAAGGLAGLMIIRALHGSATALFGPVAAATVSDLAPPDRRGRALGQFSAVQGAGQAAGAALAGALAAASLPLVFLASGLLGTAGLVLLTSRTWPRPAAHSVTAHGLLASLGEVVRHRGLLTVSGLQAGLMAISGATGAFLPLFARDALGLSTPAIGLVVAAQIGATLATRPLAGGFSDRVGRALVMQIGLLTVATAVVLMATADRAAPLVLGSILFGAGVALAGAAASAHVTDLSRQSAYGAAHGVFGTIYDIGDAAGPIVAGLVVTAVGYRPLFAGAALWALLLVVGSRRLTSGVAIRPGV
jgi:DHA1 family multidrug resistance protein-like MFS transporter